MASDIDSHYITVGIPTAGEPRIKRSGELTILENQLIGVGFHWERIIRTVVPGEILLNDDPVYRIINRLDIETYLECVTGSEMNPAAPLEFLKAHAIISRGWALGKLCRSHPYGNRGRKNGEHRYVDWEDTDDHKGFDVCSDDHCQRYQGLQPISKEAKEAVAATAGIVLTTESGELVDARFSKCCGGVTELFSTCWQDENPPCLESVCDPWCDFSGMKIEQRHKLLSTVLKDYDRSLSGGYEWIREIPKSGIRDRLLKLTGQDIGEIETPIPVSRGKSGRIWLMRVTGRNRDLEVGKELLIRRILAADCLYSSAIEITDKGETLLLHGKGWGHGVGLCQTGAARMAYEGATASEILYHYYPGSQLKKISY